MSSTSYYDGEFYKYLDHIHINPPYFLNSATTGDLIGRGLSFKDNNNIGNYHSFRNLAQKRNEFFKVSLCKYFMNGECLFKDKCNFSHGEEELRTYSTKPPQSNKCQSVAANDLLSISAMNPPKLNCRQQRFLKRNEITQVEKTQQPSDKTTYSPIGSSSQPLPLSSKDTTLLEETVTTLLSSLF